MSTYLKNCSELRGSIVEYPTSKILVWFSIVDSKRDLTRIVKLFPQWILIAESKYGRTSSKYSLIFSETISSRTPSY